MRSGPWAVVPVFEKNPACIALRVVKLLCPHRPEEGGKANPAQEQRHGDEDGEDLHLLQPPNHFSLMALRETVIDDSDIARAAAKGVAWPIRARGTATTL